MTQEPTSGSEPLPVPDPPSLRPEDKIPGIITSLRQGEDPEKPWHYATLYELSPQGVIQLWDDLRAAGIVRVTGDRVQQLVFKQPAPSVLNSEQMQDYRDLIVDTSTGQGGGWEYVDASPFVNAIWNRANQAKDLLEQTASASGAFVETEDDRRARAVRAFRDLYSLEDQERDFNISGDRANITNQQAVRDRLISPGFESVYMPRSRENTLSTMLRRDFPIYRGDYSNPVVPSFAFGTPSAQPKVMSDAEFEEWKWSQVGKPSVPFARDPRIPPGIPTGKVEGQP